MSRHSISETGFYDAARGEGVNVARLAAGVQQLWENSHGHAGKDAGFRLVQAGFHFRTALMGIKRAEAAGTASGAALAVLDEEEDQLLAFSGAKEADHSVGLNTRPSGSCFVQTAMRPAVSK